VLHREEPVVAMQVVPVERVRLVKSVVRDERTVREQLRKERVQIETEDRPPS
jgi:stress response protein YsnF